MSGQPEGLLSADVVRIRHMRDAVRRAVELGAGREIQALEPDSETALALTRLLEIMGEAARHVSSGTQSTYPDIPWKLIAGMRNRIIHEYFDVDYQIVEAVIRNDLPRLIDQLEAILKQAESSKAMP